MIEYEANRNYKDFSMKRPDLHPPSSYVRIPYPPSPGQEPATPPGDSAGPSNTSASSPSERDTGKKVYNI